MQIKAETMLCYLAGRYRLISVQWWYCQSGFSINSTLLKKMMSSFFRTMRPRFKICVKIISKFVPKSKIKHRMADSSWPVSGGVNLVHLQGFGLPLESTFKPCFKRTPAVDTWRWTIKFKFNLKGICTLLSDSLLIMFLQQHGFQSIQSCLL